VLLLCYEDVLAGDWCHRKVFAEWWQEQTGQVVEELRPAQGSLLDQPTPASTRPKERDPDSDLGPGWWKDTPPD
jgi:hypothetical protein